MHLEIPEGANVQIIVGQRAALALPNETDAAPRLTARAARPWTRGIAVGLLLFGSFTLGQRFGGRPDASALAPAADTGARPEPAAVAGPVTADGLRGRQPAGAAAQVPPAFEQQLRRPPTVVPPPGQEAPGRSPFGL